MKPKYNYSKFSPCNHCKIDLDAIAFFLKVGKEKNIISLVEEGNIFANTISYFKKTDDTNPTVGDSYENVFAVHNYNDIVSIKFINPKNKKVLLHLKKGSIINANLHTVGHYKIQKGNIYCVYAITYRDILSGTPINTQMKEFGTHFTIIQAPAFVSKMEDAVRQGVAKESNLRRGAVKYYDHKRAGRQSKLTLFHKRLSYSFQKEYRFAFDFQDDVPLNFNIGSLKEVAKVYDIDKLAGLSTKDYSGIWEDNIILNCFYKSSLKSKLKAS